MALQSYTTIEGKRTNSVWYVVDSYCLRSAAVPSGNFHTLKCVLYKPKSATHCPVRGTLVIDVDKVRVRGTHNHDKEDLEAHKLQRKVYAKAESMTSSTIRDIFDDETRHHPSAALITFKNVESNMTKRRRKIYPKTPASIQEYVEALQENSGTLGLNFKGPLVLDGEICGAAFAHDYLLHEATFHRTESCQIQPLIDGI